MLPTALVITHYFQGGKKLLRKKQAIDSRTYLPVTKTIEHSISLPKNSHQMLCIPSFMHRLFLTYIYWTVFFSLCYYHTASSAIQYQGKTALFSRFKKLTSSKTLLRMLEYSKQNVVRYLNRTKRILSTLLSEARGVFSKTMFPIEKVSPTEKMDIRKKGFHEREGEKERKKLALDHQHSGHWGNCGDLYPKKSSFVSSLPSLSLSPS